MAHDTPDRRVRRTKRRLKKALLELIDERGYETITVRELTDRADVGRSTFYSHFDSKEALLFDGFEQWVLSLAEATAPPAADAGSEGGEPGGGASPRFHFSLPLLRHMRGRERFFRAIVDEASSPRIRKRIVALVAEAARRELDPCSGPERALEGEAHAVAGAFLGTASWWLSVAPGLAPGEVDAVFQRAVVGPGDGGDAGGSRRGGDPASAGRAGEEGT